MHPWGVCVCLACRGRLSWWCEAAVKKWCHLCVCFVCCAGAGEFERYPQVGFMQCKTTSIRIHNNFWENMIARFTNDVYR